MSVYNAMYKFHNKFPISNYSLQLLCEKMIGPSLLDLQIRTNSTIEQVSWCLSVRALGGTVGGIVLGMEVQSTTSF